MPHRRSRKSAAAFLCGVIVLFLLQTAVYPAQGQECAGSGSGGLPPQGKTANGNCPAGTGPVLLKLGSSGPVHRVTVRRGETIWSLAQEYGTTVKEMDALNGLCEPNEIEAGQTLWVPVYAESFDPSVGKVQVVNVWVADKTTSAKAAASTAPGVVTAGITAKGGDQRQPAAGNSGKEQVSGPGPGQPGVKSGSGGAINLLTLTAQSSIPVSRGEGETTYSQSDVELLARVIYAEARGEDFEGQVAVGAVVLNRLKDPHFPKTIRGVIFQPGAFTSVADHQILLKPDAMAYKAAEAALAGEDPTHGALYYYNPRLATDRWIKTRPVITQIGNHVFSI
ncbi:spore cortex-lytic enzyme precursor [Peptococcaceae bacterium CEB3]|nr:spore cortex-lytic enzyme precursor [Peptococcaceae bacterium CEB3]